MCTYKTSVANDKIYMFQMDFCHLNWEFWDSFEWRITGRKPSRFHLRNTEVCVCVGVGGWEEWEAISWIISIESSRVYQGPNPKIIPSPSHTHVRTQIQNTV